MKPIILMAISWYVAYALSYCDIEEILQDRGLVIDHATINRWVIEYAPQLAANFKTKKKAVKSSWRMDETYIKVKRQSMYQYRAVDKDGDTVDCYFAKNLYKKAALAFFRKAMLSSGKPTVVNIDKSGSNTAAFNEINKNMAESGKIKIRQNKYLNNMIEKDHMFMKKIARPTLGFKAMHSARATLDGIEVHHMLRKGQHINSKNQSVIEQFYALAA